MPETPLGYLGKFRRTEERTTMATKLTFTNRRCSDCEESAGVHEYGGLCGVCWLELDDEKRATLLGRKTPKEIVTYRTVVYPPRQPFLAVAKFVWAALVTAAVAMLMYGRMR